MVVLSTGRNNVSSAIIRLVAPSITFYTRDAEPLEGRKFVLTSQSCKLICHSRWTCGIFYCRCRPNRVGGFRRGLGHYLSRSALRCFSAYCDGMSKSLCHPFRLTYLLTLESQTWSRLRNERRTHNCANIAVYQSSYYYSAYLRQRRRLFQGQEARSFYHYPWQYPVLKFTVM